MAVEALHALEELLAEEMEPGGGVLGPALQLSELLWRSGDEEDAISMLESSMERLATGPGVLVIPVLCRHARRVQDLAPLFDRLLTASISRCMEPALPEDRCELLLLLAEQIPAARVGSDENCTTRRQNRWKLIAGCPRYGAPQRSSDGADSVWSGSVGIGIRSTRHSK